MNAKRIKKIRKEAAERLNKWAFIQFRIEPYTVDQLYVEANKLGLPVGTMIGMWVMERLKHESA